MKTNHMLSNIKRVIRIGDVDFIKSLLGCILASLMNITIVVLSSLVISEVTNQAYSGTYNLYQIFKIGAVFLIAVPLYIFGIFGNLCGGQKASIRFKKQLISKSIHHDESHVKDSHTSHIMSVLSFDGDTIDDFYFQSLNWRIVQPIIQGVLAIVLLLIQNVWIGLLCIVIGVMSVIATNHYSEIIQKADREARELYQESTKTLSEIIANDEAIRLLNLNDSLVDRYQQENEAYVSKRMESETLNERINTWNKLFTVLSRSLILGIGVVMFMSGSLQFGIVFVLIPLQSLVSNMFSSLVSSRNYLAEVGNAAARSFEVMDAPLQDLRLDHPRIQIENNDPILEFKEVSFQYPNAKELFENFNLKINRNTTCAFVGESGSGKSTIFQLLLGYFNVDKGEVFLEGQDIYESSLESLRENIVYIEQSAPLFHRSVKENIAIGSKLDLKDVSIEQVVEAAKSANIHEFIMSLPEGYDTILAEGGSTISGGQKQRIAIARAFMSNAEILVMDEPTSALDNESERQIQLALEKLKGNKTVLIAAHRLSTIQDADDIIVLNHGKIVEQGTHVELCAKKGYYYSLNQSQM